MGSGSKTSLAGCSASCMRLCCPGVLQVSHQCGGFPSTDAERFVVVESLQPIKLAFDGGVGCPLNWGKQAEGGLKVEGAPVGRCDWADPILRKWDVRSLKEEDGEDEELRV